MNTDTKNYKVAVDKGDKFFKNEVHLDSAFYYYTLAKGYSPDASGEDHTYVLAQMGAVQQYIGDYFGSEETITEALSNYEGKVYKPYLYNLLAVAYDKQKRFDDALEYYKKAYNGFEDHTAKILAQNNIGLIYQQQGKHEKALQVFKPLLTKQNRKIDIALILGNLGYSQFKLKNPDAYPNLLKALQLTDSLKDVIGSITINIHLSEFFLDKDALKSRQYAFNAFNAARKVKSPDEELESLKWLIQTVDEKNIRTYANDFMVLNHSLNLSRNSAKNQFAKIKYDSKKAIEGQEKYRVRMQLALLSALLIALIAAFLFYYLKKRSQKRLIDSVNETEGRIAKKIHDELANDVYQTIAFTEIQSFNEEEDKDMLLDKLANLYTKARDISQMNGEIHTGEQYGEFLLDLIDSFDSNDVNIITKSFDEVDWNKFSGHVKIAVYRVLQELLVNMKKHSNADLVVLDFKETSKQLQIKYADNGKGVNLYEFSKKGLANAENRILALRGRFIFELEEGKGFKLTILIPK